MYTYVCANRYTINDINDKENIARIYNTFGSKRDIQLI